MSTTEREIKMQGSVGDEVIVDGPSVGAEPHRGEVLDVLRTGGILHYRVRWDDGTDCIFFPGPDASFVHRG